MQGEFINTFNYVQYLRKHLGLSDVLLATPLEELVEDLNIEDNGSESSSNGSTEVQFHSIQWEVEPPPVVENQKISAIFVRVIDPMQTSLKEDIEALTLFDNLRKAVGYDVDTAPYLEVRTQDQDEVSLDHTMSEYLIHFLTQKMNQEIKIKIIYMYKEKVLSPQSANREWIIPDPSVLVQQTQLKRPTWDLLKSWKQTSVEP